MRGGRLLLVLTLGLTLVGGLTAPIATAAPPDGVIEVVGNGGASAELVLAQDAELMAFHNVFSSRPWFERPGRVVGDAKGAFVGWYLQRMPDRMPVAGFLTIKAFDAAFGGPTPVSLVRDYLQVLPAGRYRVVLIGDGPVRVRIPTVEPRPGLSITAATPHGITHADVLRWESPASSDASPFEFGDGSTFFWEIGWSRTDVAGAHADVTCITVPGDPTCAQSLPARQPGSGGGAVSGTPGSWGGGAGLRHFAPDEIPPGRYDHVLHGAGASTAGGALLIGLPDAGDPRQAAA